MSTSVQRNELAQWKPFSICDADVRPSSAALSGDVSTAENVSPFPNEGGERDWRKGLADYATAAAECTRGSTELSLSLMQDSSAKLDDGALDIRDLLDLFGP